MSEAVSRRVVAIGCAAALCLGASGTARADEQLIRRVFAEQGGYACLSGEEQVLLDAVNAYRLRNNLRAIDSSRSLTMVARMHAIDLVENRPASGRDSRGARCTLHSWSESSFWSPVCYTADHRHQTQMLNKPAEITRWVYGDDGYENVYWTSAPPALPRQALENWRKSPKHNAVILEKGKWRGSNWSALGVGIYRNVALIWLGRMQDPMGPLQACGQPGDESR